jgi:hypothetical protein
MYTTFEDEKLVFQLPNGEALVTATIAGKREYVAAAKDGYRTDYPYMYPNDDTHTVYWDNPEWFTKDFKKKAIRAIVARQGL